jgi:hypothetical protein
MIFGSGFSGEATFAELMTLVFPLISPELAIWRDVGIEPFGLSHCATVPFLSNVVVVRESVSGF